jgi:hypothetical protein
MSKKCIRCGVAVEPHSDACPRCSVAHLMAVDSPPTGGHEASSVSVPVRRKRTLPNSCFLGVLLFIPVMFIAAMLVHFQLENQEKLDQRMLQNPPGSIPAIKRLNRDAMVKMITVYVEKQSPGVVTSLESTDGKVMTATVTPSWRDLSKDKKKAYKSMWLEHWLYLGGSSMVIEAVSDGAEKK